MTSHKIQPNNCYSFYPFRRKFRIHYQLIYEDSEGDVTRKEWNRHLKWGCGNIDGEELFLGKDGWITNHPNPDTDGNGDHENNVYGDYGFISGYVINAEGILYCTNPKLAGTNSDKDNDKNDPIPLDDDIDGDGLTNIEENTKGSDEYITDPENPDSEIEIDYTLL